VPPPSKIILIRHAEKPNDDGTPPLGITNAGANNPHSLIVNGWARAGALIGFFTKPAPPIETPATIFTATPKDAGHKPHHSARPWETVTPLGAALRLPLDVDFAVGDEVALAAKVLQQSGVVLVCWEHHAIRTIVEQFIPGFAQDWPDRFDLVWILTAGGGGWAFTQTYQHLLAGDS